MYFRVAIVLVGLVMGQACGKIFEPEKACHFVQNSRVQRISWKEEVPVTIAIDESVPPEFHDGILLAMETWEKSLGKRLFAFGGIVSAGAGPTKDGQSVIHWSKEWGDGEKCQSASINKSACEQARTTVYWMANQIYEADIAVNSANFEFSVSDIGETHKVDFESLMVHELGHVLGLSHNDEAGGSVMATSLAYAKLRREPTNEDLDSLRCEY